MVPMQTIGPLVGARRVAVAHLVLLVALVGATLGGAVPRALA